MINNILSIVPGKTYKMTGYIRFGNSKKNLARYHAFEKLRPEKLSIVRCEIIYSGWKKIDKIITAPPLVELRAKDGYPDTEFDEVTVFQIPPYSWWARLAQRLWKS